MRKNTPALIAAVRRLFPHCATEAKTKDGQIQPAIDFDLLRQELSDCLIDGPAERYQLNWPGKHQALLSANQPIRKTFFPQPKESLHFQTTQNLFIEGDNLEALKLLQKAYSGKVKSIYIDPPYNTGKDFVYQDNWKTPLKEYLRQTGQLDANGKRLQTAETNGRKHSRWLSMMYPRLYLARNLLSDNGAIFISIDDNESHNLRHLLDEIFGPENFIAAFSWISNFKGRQIGSTGPAKTHEQVLCYAKDIDEIGDWKVEIQRARKEMPDTYRVVDYEVKMDERGEYVIKNDLYNNNQKFNEVTCKSLVFDVYFNPQSGEFRCADVDSNHNWKGFVRVPPRENNDGMHRFHAWRWSRGKIEKDSHDLEVIEKDGKYKIYTKIRNFEVTTAKDLITNISGADGALKKLGIPFFQSPKPVRLIEHLLRLSTSPATEEGVDDLCLMGLLLRAKTSATS